MSRKLISVYVNCMGLTISLSLVVQISILSAVSHADGARVITDDFFNFRYPLERVFDPGPVFPGCWYGNMECAHSNCGIVHTGVDYRAGRRDPIWAANFGEHFGSTGSGSYSVFAIFGQGDHGLGNAVGLRYLLDNGRYLWDLNGHLTAHYELPARPGDSDRFQLPAGAIIGTAGDTGGANGVHDHYEIKYGPVLGNPWPGPGCSGQSACYGYVCEPNSPDPFGYLDPEAVIGNPAYKVLIPKLDRDGVDFGYGEVYGVANVPLHATLELRGVDNSIDYLCVASRRLSDDMNRDFPCQSNVGGGDPGIHVENDFAADDYAFFAALQLADPDDSDWKSGFRKIFSILPTENDVIRDNDAPADQDGTVFFQSSADLAKERVDGYLYGGFVAGGNTLNWAQWYARVSGRYEIWAFVGGGGLGSAPFVIYPNPSFSITTDEIDFGGNPYRWRRLTTESGQQTIFDLEEDGYVGLVADGVESDRYLFDAMKFVRNVVGVYETAGWTADSPRFLEAYEQRGGPEELGYPVDHNGGGEYVHWWSNSGSDPGDGVWIQDLQRTTAQAPWPDGRTALILNDSEVFLLKEGFWAYYMNHQGFLNLGAPSIDEYVVNGISRQEFAKGILTWDPSAPGDGITHYANDGTVIRSYEVDFISSVVGATVWNRGILVGEVPATMEGCEGCSYVLEVEVPSTAGAGAVAAKSTTRVEYELTVGSGPMTVDLDEILETGLPSGSITSPSGTQTAEVTVAATVSDADGVERVTILFPGGADLALCGLGAPDVCSGTGGSYSRSNVDPAMYGASAGAVTLRLFVEDSLGNNVEIQSHVFTWAPSDPGPGFTLTVVKQGDGDGTVSGEGISCGPGCTSTSATYNDGDTLTLTGSGDEFIGFTGDRCYGLADCAITMYSDLTVNVAFALPDSFGVEYTYPTSGNTGVSTNTQPAVTFNRDIAAGPNFSSLAFRECDGGALGFNPVLGSGTHDERLTFVLDNPMARDTCHVAEVPAGSISDLNGNPLSAPVSFTFTTEEDGTPQMYVSAYPPLVMEGRETKVSIWFEVAVDYDRTLTLTSSPSGALFHPSSVTLAAGQVLYEVQVDTDLDHGNLDDVAATLQVNDVDAGTLSANITIVNDTAQPGAYLHFQAAAVFGDDDGDGIFEADERADIRFDVVNLGSQAISNVILDFEVANTYNMRFLGGSPHICHIGFLDRGRNGSCTKTLLADDDLPTGPYYINVHGTGTVGSTTDHMYDNARITVVNDVRPDFTLNAGSFSSSPLQPGSQQTVRYTANNISDGFDLRLPAFEVFIDIDGQEHLLHRTYADARGDFLHSQTFDLPFTVPEVPGSHTIRARINSTGVIPEVNSDNNEAAEITLNVAEPNLPPDLPSPIGPLTVNVGESLAFTVPATDPNNDPLTYSLGPGAPSGLAIHSTTGLLSWTPVCATTPQLYNVEVNIADPDQETASGIVIIDVRRQADLGVIKTSTFTSALPGATVDFTVEVRNHGPSCVTGAMVSDVFTADFTEISWICAASNGSSCTAGPVSGSIADNAVDLLSGGVSTYTVSAKITDTATALVSNQAGVTVPTGVSDPNVANDSGSTSISLQNLDFGDAPDASLGTGRNFPTRLVDDGARHGIDPALVLGSTIDGENDGQPSEGAVGDDNAAADDESGVVFLTPMATCETADLEVTASAPGLLDAWVDFNVDGDWSDGGEQVFNNRNLVAGVNALSFEVPCSAVPTDQTHLRFRLSSSGSLLYAGLALDGEVEDYALPILGLDFGDAPAGFPTLRAEDGPRHLLSLANLMLGQRVDAEADGLPEINAAGDDVDDALDDEDGIAFTSPLVAGDLASVTVTVSAPARLDAWIDFNGDGDWADTGEQIFANEAVPTAGTNLLSFAVPETTSSGLSTFGRFRLSSAGGLSVAGLASDGEVEDHPVTISETADLTLTLSDSPDPAAVDSTLTYTILVSNQGPSEAPNVVVTNILPTGVSFVATNGCTEDPGGIPDCNLGTILAGASKQYTLTGLATSGGSVSNTACVAAGVPEAVPGDECATEETVIEAAADLALVKNDSPDPVAPGDPLTYTLTVTNLGPSISTGGQVTDVLPVGLSFVSSADGCSEVAGTANCAFGPLADGESVSLSFVVTVHPSATGTITNMATVAGNESDPAPGNNIATASTAVEAPCFALTLDRSGSGAVPTASPSGAGCPVGSYQAGEVIDLTAAPDLGWTVGSWSGSDDDDSISTNNTATIPASAHTVSVAYVEEVQPCLLLTLDRTGPGSIPEANPQNSPDCPAGEFHPGDSIELTATPDAGWTVGVWTGTDDDSSIHLVNTMTMPGVAHLVVAEYVPCVAQRALPFGYAEGQPTSVIIEAEPSSSVLVYAVEETAPEGWPVTDISGSGLFDINSGTVKWGPFFDNETRSLSYTVTPPVGTTGSVDFEGVISTDGDGVLICGNMLLDPASFHPADIGDNWGLEINEITAYGAAWKTGAPWPRPPVLIPIDFVTNAGFLWKVGEVYHFDPTQEPPWFPGSASAIRESDRAGDDQMVVVNTAVSTFDFPEYTPGEGLGVTIAVVPDGGTQVYAVEDGPPAGWTISGISDGGAFDTVNGLVKWGPFFDNLDRDLSYVATPPLEETGTHVFSGQASFNGVSVPVTGDRTIDRSCTYAINPSSQTFSAGGGSGTVSVTAPAGCFWTAQSNEGWATIDSGSAGSGDGSVGYTVAANTSGVPRSGTLTIGGETFTVTQDGVSCSYSINPTSVDLPSAGGSGTVTVTSPEGCPWTAVSTVGWLSVDAGSSGSGAGNVDYSVSPNSSSLARTGTLTIAGQTFTVAQEGVSCSYSINPPSADLPSAGGSGTVTVTSPEGCPWTALSNVSWLSVDSGSSGNGVGDVGYSVSLNSSSLARSGTLTIAGETFAVTQEGVSCSYSINPPSADLPSAGGSGTVTVTSPEGCPWAALSNVSWLSVDSGSSGSGVGDVGYSASPNSSSVPRSGTLTIAGQIFAVTQDGVECFSLQRNHVGSGSDPLPTPPNSAGCPEGEYHLGEMIDLAATPDLGWLVGSWIGTNDDASTSTINTATMPASDHTITVHYVEEIARILVVDDDDNNPDVRSYYSDAITAVDPTYAFDVWDTENTDNEPDAATLDNYAIVIWFSGAETGGFAGPAGNSEAALGNYLSGGGCLFLSSQDYLWDRGGQGADIPTAFMMSYLGVASGVSDVQQTTVTGFGPAFGTFGDHLLSFPFVNSSDVITPDGTAESAFNGDAGSAAVSKEVGVHRAIFLGFPFEALPTAEDREEAMRRVLDFCGRSSIFSDGFETGDTSRWQ